MTSINPLLGFTLGAKVVSSKHFTEVHLKISGRSLENLVSHLMTKFVSCKHFRTKISYTYHNCDCSAVKSRRNAYSAKEQHSNSSNTSQRNKRHLLYFSRMAQQHGFRQRNCCSLANRGKKMHFRVTLPMFSATVCVPRNVLVEI